MRKSSRTLFSTSLPSLSLEPGCCSLTLVHQRPTSTLVASGLTVSPARAASALVMTTRVLRCFRNHASTLLDTAEGDHSISRSETTVLRENTHDKKNAKLSRNEKNPTSMIRSAFHRVCGLIPFRRKSCGRFQLDQSCLSAFVSY